jgi:hypothetical protein
MLLAAATTHSITIFSLEHLVRHLFSHQTQRRSSFTNNNTNDAPSVWSTLSPPSHACHKVASLNIRQHTNNSINTTSSSNLSIVALDWTQQLDGLLVSTTDRRLTMWALHAIIHNNNHHHQSSAIHDTDPQHPEGSFTLHWQTEELVIDDNPQLQQDIISAGVTVDAPSASTSTTTGGGTAFTNSNMPTVSTTNNNSDRNNVNVWWPQAQTKTAKREKLKHSCGVVNIEWSPGVLRKDVLAKQDEEEEEKSIDVAVVHANNKDENHNDEDGDDIDGGRDEMGGGGPDVLNNDDHPALLTTGEDGALRIWVETVIVQYDPAASLYGGNNKNTNTNKSTTIKAGSSSSPSPRDSTQITPKMDSYFCMTMVIDPPPPPPSIKIESSSSSSNPIAIAVKAKWGRWVKALLGRPEIPGGDAFWILSMVQYDDGGGGGGGGVQVRLHVVRGLSAIIVNSFGGNMSTAGAGSVTRQAKAVEWGHSASSLASEAAAGAAGESGRGNNRGRQNAPGLVNNNSMTNIEIELKEMVAISRKKQFMSCWITTQDEYPEVNVFASTVDSDKGTLSMCGIRYATIVETGPGSLHPTKQLTSLGEWVAKGHGHTAAITAIAAVQGGGGGGGREKVPAVATADASGAVILWCPATSVARDTTKDRIEESNNTGNTWSPVCKLQCATTSFLPPSSTTLESGSPVKQGATQSHTAAAAAAVGGGGLCMAWVGVDSTPLQLLAVSIGSELSCYEFTSLTPSDMPLSPKSPPPSHCHHHHHQQQQQQQQQGYGVSEQSASYLLCSTAIPQALGTVISLHALSESRSILGAICAVGGASGVALLCLWQCSIGGGGGGNKNSSTEMHSNRLPSLRLLGTVPLPRPTNTGNISGIKSSGSIVCTASHGTDSIVLAYSGGTVKKMTVIVHGPGNIQLVQDFEYKISSSSSSSGGGGGGGGDDGNIVVASDAEHGLVAAALGGDVHIKNAKGTAGSSSSSSSSSSSAAAAAAAAPVVVLSFPHHYVATSLAWLTGTVFPCLVVGCRDNNSSTSGTAAMWYALTRSGEWRCIASLKNTSRGRGGLSCLAVVGSTAQVMATDYSNVKGGHLPPHYYQKPGTVMTPLHNRLVAISDHVTITPPSYANDDDDDDDNDTVDGVSIPLAQHILQCSGPLMQYSSQFLSCLLHNRQYNAVEKIVTELVAWLKELHLRTSGGGGGSGLLSPGRPLSLTSHFNYGVDGGHGGVGSGRSNITAGVDPLSFNGIGLDELILGNNSDGGGCINGLRDGLLKKHKKYDIFGGKKKNNKEEEMGAGGSDGGFVAQPSPAAEKPAAPTNSGMLDLAAFGMDNPPAPQPSQDTGMLDLAAFGMDMPPASQPSQDTGMLDLAAFGMDMPQSQSAQQPSATTNAIIETPKDIITIASTSTTKQNTCFTAPAGQSLVTAEQLKPLPADLSVLLSVLLGAPPEQHPMAVQEEGHTTNGGEYSLFTRLQSSNIGGLEDKGNNDLQDDSSISNILPGLSLKESKLVVQLIKQFSKGNGIVSIKTAAATGPVDECGSRFLSAVVCANVLGTTQPARYNNGSDGVALQHHQQQHTSMNAAGVAYTLPPSLSGRGEGPKEEKEKCAFGMLPGLDMGSLFWALLSTTEESLLHHCLDAANAWLTSIKGNGKTVVDGDTSMKSAAAPSFINSSFAPSSSSVPSGDSGGEMVRMTWAKMRLVGAGFWLRDALLLSKTAETLAKGQFAKNRNPDDAALLYTAMGKKSVLRGLYSSTNNKRQADFLGRDFSYPENQQAAIKNAYVLMSKHRHELAAAFFILGGSNEDAVGVCAKEMKDPQLALFIARLLNNNGPGGEVERGVIEREVGVESDGGGNTTMGGWGAAVCAWLLGDADKVMSSLLLEFDASTAQLVSPARESDDSNGNNLSTTAAAVRHMLQLPSLLKFLIQTLPRLGLLRHQDKQKEEEEEAIGQYGDEDQERMVLIEKVHDCLYSAAEKLASFGLPALAMQLETIADSQCRKPFNDSSDDNNEVVEEEESSKAKMCAMALLTCRGKSSSSPEEQLTNLTSAGLVIDKAAVIEKYHRYNSMVLHISKHTGAAAAAAGTGSSSTSLNRQLSFETTQSTLSGHSLGDTATRSSLDLFKLGPHHHEAQRAQHGHHHNRSSPLLKEDHPLFRIEHDQLRAVATCSLMSQDVLGRTVVVATHKHGLVEGEAHVLLPPSVKAAANRPRSSSTLSSPRGSGSLVGGAAGGGGGGGSGSASVASIATTTTTTTTTTTAVACVAPVSSAASVAPVSSFVEESDNNSGKNGLFSRVLSQIFDQAGWAADDGWGGVPSEADFSAAALHAMQQQQGRKNLSPQHSVGNSNNRPSPSPQSPFSASFASSTAGKFFTGSNSSNTIAKPMSTSTIHTCALCAHPSRSYYLSGDDSRGRIFLWRFGSRTSLASFTPVPASELPALTNVGGLLESFSTRMRPTGTSNRLSSWKYCTGLAFSPNGERFAGIGAGGVVATWRLAPPSSSSSSMTAAGGISNTNTSGTTTRPVDADGNISSEWWCQGLSKHGAAVTYVAGGSSAVAVGGQCTKGGNIALWDTLSHPESGAIGRLSHHKAAVTCLCTLPGGWLLAAGDADGALSLTDIRMLGTTSINNNNATNSTGSGGGRVLWSVKASRGAVKSVVTTSAATTSSSGMSGLLVTGGQDGAVRVWRSGDGHLVQSIEAAHYSGSNMRPKHGKLAMNGDLSSPTSSSSGVAVAVSGLSACSEGVVTCGADGMVRLFPVG